MTEYAKKVSICCKVYSRISLECLTNCIVKMIKLLKNFSDIILVFLFPFSSKMSPTPPPIILSMLVPELSNDLCLVFSPTERLDSKPWWLLLFQPTATADRGSNYSFNRIGPTSHWICKTAWDDCVTWLHMNPLNATNTLRWIHYNSMWFEHLQFKHQECVMWKRGVSQDWCY